MMGLIEIMLDDHLRWKLVRLCFVMVNAVPSLFSVAHKRPRYTESLDRPSGGNSFRIEPVWSSFGVLGSWMTMFHETHGLVGAFLVPTSRLFRADLHLSSL